MLSKLPPLLALLALAATACLPKPEEPIEWLRREDAVIVQMRTSGSSAASPGGPLLEVPEFTLYGDGRLIVRGDIATRAVEAEVADGAIENLLEEIDDSGLFNFPYEVSSPGSDDDAPATYLYVNTKLAANATGARAIESAAPESGEWKQFRRLQSIRASLLELAQDALAGGPTDYEPDAVLLIVRHYPSTVTGPLPREWPFPEIDLASALSDDEVGTRRVAGDDADSVAAFIDEAGEGAIMERALAYTVGYRPILPFEEHFPEFEAAQ